ncbi:MAG: helix-turn-helix transcriptional regulator [Lachnospiraceae bacterium]|nr:helix-turn-helix transcriptional regulator [Lachnospiraceae bacterium]MBQ6259176.1 helix-turn-helix transcriptional regulator [Lachnospiraceae bacterium]
MKKRYEDGNVPDSSLLLRSAVAREIRDSRKTSRLTQQELADLSGTQKSNISRLESGTYNPTLDFLSKVASSMGRRVSINIVRGDQ